MFSKTVVGLKRLTKRFFYRMGCFLDRCVIFKCTTIGGIVPRAKLQATVGSSSLLGRHKAAARGAGAARPKCIEAHGRFLPPPVIIAHVTLKCVIAINKFVLIDKRYVVTGALFSTQRLIFYVWLVTG